MRRKFIFLIPFFLTLLVSFSLCGEDLNHNVLPYKKKLKEKILNGQIFSEASVSSSTQGPKKNQELHFSIAGLHQKSCSYALRTLSQYENYNKLLDFVKKSSYETQNKEIHFLLVHPLLPYDMELIFKLPKITQVGMYSFVFEQGILKNLKGTIYVIEHNNRCLFYAKADWEGPSTGFPNIVLEVFSKTLAKLAMEKLFRVSSVLKH